MAWLADRLWSGGESVKTPGVLLLVALVPVFAAGESRPDQVAFRELVRELVETNTTLSAGSCTEAAEMMAGRLQAAGLPD